MKKLSLEELAKKAKEVASEELLNTIAGGNSGEKNLNNCHGDGCHNNAAELAVI